MLLLGSVNFIEGVIGDWLSPSLGLEFTYLFATDVIALTAMPPSVTAVIVPIHSGPDPDYIQIPVVLRLLKTASPGDAIVGDWPLVFRPVGADGVAISTLPDMRVNVSFLPAREAMSGQIDAHTDELSAFYYALCGGPLCQEYINGQ